MFENRGMKRGLFLLLMVWSISIYPVKGQLSDKTIQVLKQLDLKPKQCYEPLMVEAPMPGQPDMRIVVVPKMVQKKDDHKTFNSYIAIVENKTNRVQKHYFESAQTNHWVSDAIQLTQIEIEPTPYALTGSAPAFALRLQFQGSSAIYPFSQTRLSIFQPEKEQIKCVLQQYEVATYQGTREGDCTNTTTKTVKQLQVAPNDAYGYMGFMVLHTVTTEKEQRIEGKCQTLTEEKEQTEYLQYNGKTYETIK